MNLIFRLFGSLKKIIDKIIVDLYYGTDRCGILEYLSDKYINKYKDQLIMYHNDVISKSTMNRYNELIGLNILKQAVYKNDLRSIEKKSKDRSSYSYILG